jgi:hypothetical protein
VFNRFARCNRQCKYRCPVPEPDRVGLAERSAVARRLSGCQRACRPIRDLLAGLPTNECRCSRCRGRRHRRPGRLTR